MPHSEWVGDRQKYAGTYKVLQGMHANEPSAPEPFLDFIPGRASRREWIDDQLARLPSVGGVSGGEIVKELIGAGLGGGVGGFAGRGLGWAAGKYILKKSGRGFTGALATAGGKIGTVAGVGLLLADVIDTGIAYIEGDIFTSGARKPIVPKPLVPLVKDSSLGTGGARSMEPGVSLSLRDAQVGSVLPTPTGAMVTRTWSANGTPFVMTADGWIYVQRRNGSIKRYKPPRNIVISRNPRVGSLIKADKKLSRLKKGLKKVVK